MPRFESLTRLVWRLVLAALLDVLLLSGMAVSAAADAVTAVDDAGRQIRLPAPAQRIISLAPHATELLYAAGAGAALVAVDRYSDYPPAVTALPKVGDAFSVNLEAVLALQPDLVVAWQSAMRPEVLRQLASLGIPVFLSEPTTLAAVVAGVETLATLAASLSDAAPLAARLAGLAAPAGAAPPLPVAVLVGRQPLLSVNDRHVLADVLRRCGGRNVFADTRALVPRISQEALLAQQPALLLVPVDDHQGLAAWRAALDQLGATPVQGIAADLLARPGPRLLAAAEQVCAAIAEVQGQAQVQAQGQAQVQNQLQLPVHDGR